MYTQNVNVARFARSVEWDFFCDFQTPWTWWFWFFTSFFSFLASKFLVLTGKPEDAATKSEFLDIKNPSNTCKLPDFPTKLSDAVGGFTKKGPLICSGYDDKTSDKTSDCYRLTRDRQYQKYPNKISTARYEASSIGNVQLWFTSWQFCPLDGALIITTKKANFT